MAMNKINEINQLYECALCLEGLTYLGSTPYRLIHLEKNTHPDFICNHCVKLFDGVFYCPLCNEKVERGKNFEFEEAKDLINQLKILFDEDLKKKESNKLNKQRKKNKQEFLQQFDHSKNQVSIYIKSAWVTNETLTIIQLAKNCLSLLTCTNIGMLSENKRRNREALWNSSSFYTWRFVIMPECQKFFMEKLPTLKKCLQINDDIICYCYGLMVFAMIRYNEYDLYLSHDKSEYCNVVYECFESIEQILDRHKQLKLPFMAHYLYFYGEVMLKAVDFISESTLNFVASVCKDSKKNVKVKRREMIDKAMKMIHQSADLFEDSTIKKHVLSYYAFRQIKYCSMGDCEEKILPIQLLIDSSDFTNFDNNNLNDLHVFLSSFSFELFLDKMKDAVPLLELAANMGSFSAQLKLFKLFRVLFNKVKFTHLDINVVVKQFPESQILKYSTMDYFRNIFKSGYIGASAFLLQEYLKDVSSVFFTSDEMKQIHHSTESSKENVFEHCYLQLTKYIHEHVDQVEYENTQSVEFYQKKLARIGSDTVKWAKAQINTKSYCIYPTKIIESLEIKRIHFVVAKYFFNKEYKPNLFSIKKIRSMWNCMMLAVVNGFGPAIRYHKILTDRLNQLNDLKNDLAHLKDFLNFVTGIVEGN